MSASRTVGKQPPGELSLAIPGSPADGDERAYILRPPTTMVYQAQKRVAFVMQTWEALQSQAQSATGRCRVYFYFSCVADSGQGRCRGRAVSVDAPKSSSSRVQKYRCQMTASRKGVRPS